MSSLLKALNGFKVIVTSKLLGAIEIDCTTDESHHFSAQATQFPVENGIAITDHIRENPDELSITGFISNTPISFVPSLDNERAQGTLDALRLIKENHEIVSVSTLTREWDDVVLLDVTAPINAQTGDAVQVTLRFQQIRFASTQTAANVEPEKKAHRPTKKKGKVAKEEAKPPQDTTLFSLFSSFGK